MQNHEIQSVKRTGAAVEDRVEFDAIGLELRIGQEAPDTTLRWLNPRTNQIEEIRLSEIFSRGVTIIHPVNSVDTEICGGGVEQIEESRNEGDLPSEVFALTVSVDLPFALQRKAEEQNVDDDHHKLVSAHLSNFGHQYGVGLTGNGSLHGLLMRSVFVIDSAGRIQHVVYVRDQGSAGDSKAALEGAFEKAAELVELLK